VANALIAFQNRVDQAALSGGSYIAGLPLSNLQNRRIKSVARSSDLSLSSTQFTVDIGTGKFVRIVALVGHNLSLSARYRLRGSSDVSFATSEYDSGWLDVWPRVYQSAQIDWQALNWWTGRYLEEERQGYTWNLPIVLPAQVNYRYWKMELDDAARTDVTYVDVGRVFIGGVWQPVVNMSEGAQLGWETNTQVQESLSGAEFFQRRTPYRVAQFELGWMLDDEAFGKAFDIFRRMGVDQEVFYIYDPSDTVQLLRRSFLGRFRRLSPIEIRNFLLRKTVLEVKELL
jgi:hypothetical protein